MPNIPDAPLFQQTDTEAISTPFDRTDRTVAARAKMEVGQAIGQLGKSVESAVIKARDQADATAVQEAETAYAQAIQAKLYGRPASEDPEYNTRLNAGLTVSRDEGEVGFKALKGHTALERSADLLKDLEDTRNQIAGQLNSRQKQLFLARSQSEMIGAQRQVEVHTAEQDEYIKTEAFKTNIRTAAQSAVNAFEDPLERQRQIETTRAWLEVEAERQGLRGRDAEVFVQKYQGAMAEEVLQRLMGTEGRASDAKSFFEQNRQRIGPDAHKYEAALKRLSVTEEADQAVRQVETLFPDNREAQEKAVAALEGETGAKARDIFRERMALAEAAQRVSDGQNLGTVLDNVEARRVQNSSQLEHDRSFQKLSDEGKAKAREHLRLMLNSQRTNNAAYRRQLREMDAAALDDFLARPVEEAAGMNIKQEYAGSATPNGINRILAAQLKKKAEWDKDRGIGEVAYDRLVQSESQGVLKNDKRDMEEFKGRMRQLRSNWMNAPGNEGKQPPREEVMRWIWDELTVKDAPWFDKFAYRIDPDKRAGYQDAEEQPYHKQRQALPQAPAKQAAPAAPPSVPTRKEVNAVTEIPEEIKTKLRSDYEGWRSQHPGQPPMSDAVLIKEYNRGIRGGEW